MKKIVILFVVSLVSFSINAQSKYGLDEQKCKENLSVFREYYKQKNYLAAYAPWMWTFNNCPESSGNIYKNGPKIIPNKGRTKNPITKPIKAPLVALFPPPNFFTP